MKRLLLGVIAVFCSTLAYSQATEIVVETYATDIGELATADLTGYNTYRLYVKFTSPNDFLAAVYGDADYPVRIQAGDNFWNSGFGAMTNEGYNPLLFAGVPELEFDSFITIGMDAPASSNASWSTINTIGDPEDDWRIAFEPTPGATGSDIIIETQTGGSWFPLFPDSNAYAGADSLVLVGQFTTNNTLTGVVSVATFVEGVQPEPGENAPVVTLPFSSAPDVVFGCTNPDATNYDDSATQDDGTCVFECTYPATQLVITEASTIEVSCNGYADGIAQVSVTGGQGGKTYSAGSSANPNSTGYFSALTAGEVTITVTDNVGCSVDTTLTVGTPEPLVVTASVSDPISCNGAGDAVLGGSSTGGTGMVMYSMTEPADTGSGPYFEMASDELMFAGIDVGLYTVYALDANGCMANTPGIQVTEPSPFNLYTQGAAETTCPDSEDGQVYLLYFGGSGDGSATTYSVDGITYSTENGFTVPPGTYTFYALDVNGCADTLTDVVVGSPDAFEFEVQSVAPSCFGLMDGSISVEVQGGTAPYTYISGGDTLNAAMFTMVGAGEYEIDVVDDNGCMFDADVTLTEPSEIMIDAAVTDVVCNGDENGSLILTASGGSGMGYVYDFNGAGFGPSGEYSDLAAGTYTAAVQDDTGCSNDVSVTIGAPDAIAVSVEQNDGATGEEADGVIDITVSGGTAPYSYSWSGPGYSSEEEDATGVAAGEYTVTVTDTAGCVFESTTIVVVSGLNELVNLVEFSVSPNPTNGIVEVQLSGLIGESVTAVLTDGMGREVSRKNLGNLSGAYIERIDLAGLESAVYFLRMEVADAVKVMRIVKQ